ncbi:hypothetical protein K6119_02785 [Paracrocinitomix mangrovi]|uniref:hypothetical protein n=1 Tax=Paracrocinitomix mangrovi TaxID=2862509 RepID=UPI001C8E0C09|nr:hypothetical protein [Paracrocinitomix mangrovi]UKN02446.1 hypothetical protein K6119_02785 [Paracrocinitomix mangrovi]
MKKLILIVFLLWSGFILAQIDKESTPLQSLKGMNVRSFSSLNEDAKELLIGTKGKAGEAKVFYSDDFGTNWTSLNQDKSICANCEDIQSVCFLDEKTFLVGTKANGLYITQDKGNSFKKVDSYKDKEVRSIVRSPIGTTYIATGTMGVVKSEDNGKSWSEPLTKSLDFIKLKLPPRSNLIIYGITKSHGIHKSYDGGKNWKQVLIDKEINILDMEFIQNEIYAVGNNGKENFLFKSYMGDKNWKTYKLDMFGLVNNMHIVQTFNDYILFFGTESNGIQKSVAIEYSLKGFKCTEIIEDDESKSSNVFSNKEYIYHFSSNDGVFRFKREKECGVKVPIFVAPGSEKFDPFAIESTCSLSYFYFRIYDKYGKEVLVDSTGLNTANQKLNDKTYFQKSDNYVYWLKGNFESQVDTFNLKGHIRVMVQQ